MSEVERRYPRRWTKTDGPWVSVAEVREPGGQSWNIGRDVYFPSGNEEAYLDSEYMKSVGWLETFDHLTTDQPQPEVTTTERLSKLEEFYRAVMAATQTESNSRLPQAIFAADAEVRRATPSETN